MHMYRILNLDFRKSICSSRFMLGSILMLLWMISNVVHEIPSYERAVWSGAPYLFDMAVDGTLYMGPVLLVISTIPYSSSYLIEHDSGFQKMIVMRVGITDYCISKVLVTAVSSFLMAMVGMGLFLGALCFFRLPQSVHYDSVKGFYLDLVYTVGPGVYYVVKFVTTGLTCSLSAVFSLMCTSYISNLYMCALSPLIGYYLILCVLDLIALSAQDTVLVVLFNPTALFFGQISAGNNLFSFIWASTVLITFTVLCGRVFALKLGKDFTS